MRPPLLAPRPYSRSPGLAWLARFRVVEHPPDSVHLPALDYLHGCGTIESRVRFLQPTTHFLRLHQARKRVQQPIHFNKNLLCRSRWLLPPCPFRHGPRRKTSHTAECFPPDPEPVSYIAHGCATTAMV